MKDSYKLIFNYALFTLGGVMLTLKFGNEIYDREDYKSIRNNERYILLSLVVCIIFLNQDQLTKLLPHD